MELGIGTARRGWVEARHVLNCRPLDEVLAFIAPKRRGKRRSARQAPSGARALESRVLRWPQPCRIEVIHAPVGASLCSSSSASSAGAAWPQSARSSHDSLSRSPRRCRPNTTASAISPPTSRRNTRAVCSSGRSPSAASVQVKKPGKMRWDYTAPEKKLFVSDGLRIYTLAPGRQPGHRQPRCPKQDEATTAVLFLVGKGNLARDFNVSFMPKRRPAPMRSGCEPKLPERDYDWLQLVVDQKTPADPHADRGRPRRAGSRRFIFSNFKENVGIADKTFTFKIPRRSRCQSTLASPSPLSGCAPAAAVLALVCLAGCASTRGVPVGRARRAGAGLRPAVVEYTKAAARAARRRRCPGGARPCAAARVAGALRQRPPTRRDANATKTPSSSSSSPPS